MIHSSSRSIAVPFWDPESRVMQRPMGHLSFLYGGLVNWGWSFLENSNASGALVIPWVRDQWWETTRLVLEFSWGGRRGDTTWPCRMSVRKCWRHSISKGSSRCQCGSAHYRCLWLRRQIRFYHVFLLPSRRALSLSSAPEIWHCRLRRAIFWP